MTWLKGNEIIILRSECMKGHPKDINVILSQRLMIFAVLLNCESIIQRALPMHTNGLWTVRQTGDLYNMVKSFNRVAGHA